MPTLECIELVIVENIIQPLTYEQWFNRSSFKSGFNSLKSLNDFRDYQLNVEQHSASHSLEEIHKKDLARSREHNTIYDKKAYIPVSGEQLICEPSPHAGIMQLTNSDITILFDGYRMLEDRSIMLLLQHQAVCVFGIKKTFPLERFKSVFKNCIK